MAHFIIGDTKKIQKNGFSQVLQRHGWELDWKFGVWL
jgi:hypothetical protein